MPNSTSAYGCVSTILRTDPTCDNEHIIVDTDHPLAGETITVNLQLVAILA